MSAGAEGDAHLHLAAARALTLADLTAVAAGLAPGAHLWQAPGAVVLTAPRDPAVSVWVASADAPADRPATPDRPACHVEVVGERSLAAALAEGLADRLGGRVADAGLGGDPGAAWARRVPAGELSVGAGPVEVVEAQVAELTVGPWLRARREAAAAEGRTLVLRTPGATTASAPLRRLLREGWAHWVREVDAGTVDGAGDGSAAEPASLRVQVVHAAPDAHRVGLAAELLLGEVPGDEARMGETEPLLGPWRRAEVAGAGPRTARTWLVGAGSGPDAAAGLLTVAPTAVGVLEDVDLAVPGAPTTEQWWAAVRHLRPAVVLHGAGGVWWLRVAAHLAADYGLTGEPDARGYVTGTPREAPAPPAPYRGG